MARTPPPPDSPALLDSVNADPQQQPRAVIVLSPRQSPTPPPAPFSAEDAPAPAPAPPPRVVAASPPPPEEPLDQADHPRSLIRLLALARASFAATLATAAPTPAPAPARDPSHLTPDLYYDAAGRLRTTSSNSRVRRAVASSSATPSTSGSPRVGEEAGEDADEEALFVSSLRAGDTSRQRRRPWRAQPLDLSDADDVLSDTGWIQLGSAAAADGPEVSPEEVRAAQGALSFGGQVAYPPHQPTSSEANGTAAATDEWTFHRGAGSIWRVRLSLLLPSPETSLRCPMLMSGHTPHTHRTSPSPSRAASPCPESGAPWPLAPSPLLAARAPRPQQRRQPSARRTRPLHCRTSASRPVVQGGSPAARSAPSGPRTRRVRSGTTRDRSRSGGRSAGFCAAP
ncbi:hypothetical protein DMC30DRAFT_398633 [Rhodotorula diobovata]|uniref:Uncharacterized protein n=1 Tax=Rhodotorula diobovata TaxID=5288 RepID=A0A5C5FUR1_9BASI|nr:hypothetical protein DMC30DRAFT_398633 [Rhodotorula diobovata]